jgi:hypothetical protein
MHEQVAGVSVDLGILHTAALSSLCERPRSKLLPVSTFRAGSHGVPLLGKPDLVVVLTVYKDLCVARVVRETCVTGKPLDFPWVFIMFWGRKVSMGS